eukprot:CAMPEP_0118855176 /NCGR_PEP_ID=MMETSP1163-20130328/3077_1 /TAXON_ID=124430 /ORGANISM="Phaeomonas parva, Strain CCMP2877" /LENGTH=307 /DNA_ID=CAMNT_0006788021 /DNA_START=73 /DNA_END=996 /DNA_ORIENTATION=+
MRLVILAALLAAAAGAAAPAPHDHRGKIAPFPSKLPAVALTGAEEATLAGGGSVQKQVRVGAGGRGFVVQDIDAAPEVVMGRILDFPKYPKMVPNLKRCSVYEKKGGNPKTLKVVMEVGVVGISMTYYIDHKYYEKSNVITWTLDYDIKSEIDESVGYWHVAAHPTKPGWTRVTYSVGILLAPWVPTLVVNIMTKQALSAATTWVKKESTKEADRLGRPEAEGGAEPSPNKLKLGFGCRMRKLFGKRDYECEAEVVAREAEEAAAKKAAEAARQRGIIRSIFAVSTIGALFAIGGIGMKMGLHTHSA